VLAIGTATAVFRCGIQPGGSLGKCDHQLVSAVIDDVPTALALSSLPTTLYIGNNLSASVWNPDGQVERISGAQGLPAPNITVMLPGADGAVWAGHAHGLSLYLPSSPMGGSTAPPQRGPWRYFHGDRYLPGERVKAVALPAGAGPSSSPAIWAATDLGLALIEAKVETLERKASAMQALLPPLDRYGWVT